MKLVLKRICAAIVTIIFVSSMVVPSSAQSSTKSVMERETSYTGLAAERWTAKEDYENSWSLNWSDALLNGNAVNGQDVLFSENDTLSFNFENKSVGEYRIAFEYKPLNAKTTDSLFDIAIDDTKWTGTLPVLWKDSTEQYTLDKDGNELSPNQEAVDKYILNPVENYSDLNFSPIAFKLSGGKHTISITNTVQDIYIRAVYIKENTALPTYSEYRSKQTAEISSDYQIVEGERYSVKSNSSIRGCSVKNSALYPYETNVNRINVLSDSWSSVGGKVAWEFTAKQDGLYQLSFRYLQNADTNMPVYRNLEIDGQVLFQEMENILFPQTKSNTYANFTFTVNNEPAYIYLKKGTHVLSLTATMGPLAEQYQNILNLMSDVNNMGMALNKISASSTDENRTWDMEKYMPNAVSDLLSYADRAEAIYGSLKELYGLEPTYASNLMYSAEILRRIASDSRTIPNKTNDISMGDSSVSKYFGTVIAKMVNQPLSLDRIYIYGKGELPPATASFWSRLWEGIKQFGYSFTSKAASGSYADTNKNDKQLKVWVNRSIPYVQALQQVVDEKYNSVHGTDIELSVMPSEQKLILANAAGTSPDVVLGVGYSTPFNLAIRGAAKNLLEYDDFLKSYNSEYNLESLIPFCYGDGVYGAVETQDYQVLFYRKDILKTLGLSVPQTWDDVKSMMPVLLRYNMNFYLPLSSNTAFKTMAVVGPFLYQNNASFYADNGLGVSFNSASGVNAFKEMTELYSVYGAQQAVANFFNSFRYGQIPIGISGFSTYLQLELAAPELAGQWGVALVPGEQQEDGSILRYQMADSTACMILKNTNQSEQSWQFLKWWLSEDTQLTYSNLLQSTLGTEYRWNTANLKAFAQLPYPEKNKNIILEQWKSQKENASHAASYMVEREVSSVWNNVVVNGKGLVESIDSAALLSNREILRKMKEFGFCDENGNITKNYSVQTYEGLLEKLQSEGETS